ncbi:MAG: DNA translocase FtsK [Neisseria sp.]|nr:DNA translocase FtsK [Neisseria sp.]
MFWILLSVLLLVAILFLLWQHKKLERIWLQDLDGAGKTPTEGGDWLAQGRKKWEQGSRIIMDNLHQMEADIRLFLQSRTGLLSGRRRAKGEADVREDGDNKDPNGQDVPLFAAALKETARSGRVRPPTPQLFDDAQPYRPEKMPPPDAEVIAPEEIDRFLQQKTEEVAEKNHDAPKEVILPDDAVRSLHASRQERNVKMRWYGNYGVEEIKPLPPAAGLAVIESDDAAILHAKERSNERRAALQQRMMALETIDADEIVNEMQNKESRADTPKNAAGRLKGKDMEERWQTRRPNRAGQMPDVISEEEIRANLNKGTVPVSRRLRRISTRWDQGQGGGAAEGQKPDTSKLAAAAQKRRDSAISNRYEPYPKNPKTSRAKIPPPDATVVEPPEVPEVPPPFVDIAPPASVAFSAEVLPRRDGFPLPPEGGETVHQEGWPTAPYESESRSETDWIKVFGGTQDEGLPLEEADGKQPAEEEPAAPNTAPARPADKGGAAHPAAYRLPDSDLLQPASYNPEAAQSEEQLLENSITIEEKLAEYKVRVKVLEAYAGPVITRYEIEPDVGVRGNAVLNLEKDLARSLGVAAIRVVETIPGKTCMGLELPNPKRQMIRLREIFDSPAFSQSKSKLTLALGQDITGEPVVTDLAKAPHLLVAGTTGSGKSVGVNAMILSMLFKAAPEDVRMIMIDPKMLELSIYEGIPHLLAPVVTDMRLAANALNWCVNEMEKRYRLMSFVGVRNLAGYNQKIAETAAQGGKIANPFSLNPAEPEPLAKLPFIVVVVDEFADLMMTAGKKIEELIARITQKARAAGIHLILATQRPSVDVITGLIKANIPTRIAFQVSSKIDSRTILDQMGAENLLGQGDMLFLPPGTGYPQRVHGAFASDEEVHGVVEYLKQFGEPDYVDDILTNSAENDAPSGMGEPRGGGEGGDPLYDKAVACVIETNKATISSVQRRLNIGYNRAANLMEQMEADGVVSAADASGKRTVLARGGSGDV